MSVLKRIELGLRRILLIVMGGLKRRRRPPEKSLDFNRSKILFVRQDRIGDVLVSTPLLAAVKKHHPGATIDVFLSPNNHFVLANNALVRRRWIYTKRPLATLKLLAAIRRERYDFIVDLMDNPSVTSTILCALAGGRWNVGLEKENDSIYDIKIPRLSRKETHIVDRLAQLLRAFAIDPSHEPLAIHYQTSAESEALAESLFRSPDLAGRPVLGLNISAGSEARFWGIGNFHALLALLERHYPRLTALVLYRPDDRERAEEIAGPHRQAIVGPVTKSFDHFAALIGRLGLLVTPDTSAVHLAAAFGIPAVVLYVQSNKELGVWAPYNTKSEVLISDIDDLSTIAPGDVLASVRSLIDDAVTGIDTRGR